MSKTAETKLGAPADQRIDTYLNGNADPYELCDTAVKVRVSFAGECGIDEALSHYLAARDNVREAIRANQ